VTACIVFNCVVLNCTVMLLGIWWGSSSTGEGDSGS